MEGVLQACEGCSVRTAHRGTTAAMAVQHSTGQDSMQMGKGSAAVAVAAHANSRSLRAPVMYDSSGY